MPTAIKTDNRPSFQIAQSPTKKVSQSELISDLEESQHPREKPLSVKQLQEKTNKLAEIFILKSSTYAQVDYLYNKCNYGKKANDKERKLLYVVKDLSKYESPGFRQIRAVMNRYFSHLSFFKMLFFYYSFIRWVPTLYIRTTVTKILATSRRELEDGKNLPDLGSTILKTANSYLANYNNAVNKFRDDATNTLGDRDDYLREALKQKQIIGFDNTDILYAEFAKAASKEEMRPDFKPLSKTIKKIQLLKFEILDKIPKALLMPFKAITIPLGLIPYFLAKLLEIIPNLLINKFHENLIKSFAPSVLEDILKSVNKSGFTHAINCFLCDVIKDVLEEMAKNPYHKTLKEPPPIVDKSLSDIKKFSEYLFTLITREPYQTQEDLKRIQTKGLDPKSDYERFLKRVNSPEKIDREWIKYYFVDKGLHPNIIELFKFLFGQPEKFEEYLCNFIRLLNKIYDDVPDSTTPEGRALLEERKDKHNLRETLVKKLMKDVISAAIDDSINEYCYSLSKNQTKELIVTYRKIKAKTLEKLPMLEQDAKNILSSCTDLIESFSPIINSTQAKEDIELAINDLRKLVTIINNLIPDENGRVKTEMEIHLKRFKIQEKILSDSIIQIDKLHDEIEQLKSLSKELKNLKSLLTSKNINLEKIKESLDNLKILKIDSEFDEMIDEYKFLSDQFEKIQTHENYISTLKRVLTNTFFKNGLLLELAKAQKDYLNSPKSVGKAKRLKSLHQKMLDILNALKPIGDDTDISEMKDVIRKISICPNLQKLKIAYNNAKELFEKKLSKHIDLLEDEKKVSTTACFNKCIAIIKKYETAFPKLIKDTHQNLMEKAQIFSDAIEKLKETAQNIDKKKQLGFNGTTFLQTVASTAFGALGYLSNGYPIIRTLSFAASALFLGSTKYRPIRSIATKAAVPVAEASAESAETIIINSAFCEGLIHSCMRDFIKYANRSKNK
ncbi:MAG: hypothetical protein K1060chlam1_01003 [Candidatus Anoxychlamydiales bacterium]|nr:hypothetical protein [Candidatus Anoxychlamydiales bacterium]